MLSLKMKNIFPGMRLARDIHFYDIAVEKMTEIKKNTVVTQVLIDRFKQAGIEELYIDYVPESFEPIHNINEEMKRHAVWGIQQIAMNLPKLPEGVLASQMEYIGQTAEQLVQELTTNPNVLINILDLKMYDDYTFHHSLSVAVISLAIGIELGLDKTTLYELALSALLHDIGKVIVPIEIINKPARLTNDEFEIVKMHPVHAGVHLLKKNYVTENTFKGILYHHEKWDGTGYPNGLTGAQIPLFSRILAIADVYDALTSNRPYRTPTPPSEAIEYIMGGSGTHFDVQVVKAFLRKIAPYPAGTLVYLSNGQTATVVLNNPDHPLRPVVKVTDTLRFLDLYNDANTMNITILGQAT